MKFKIEAKKIPGTKEKIKEIELPDGAIPLYIETWLEHEREEGTDVLRGLYADQILYYNEKDKIFDEDLSKMTILNENNVPIIYNTFLLVRYLLPAI